MRSGPGTLSVDCALCGAILRASTQSVLDGRGTTCADFGPPCSERGAALREPGRNGIDLDAPEVPADMVRRKRRSYGIGLAAPEAPAGWLDDRPYSTAHTYAIRWRFWQAWCARNSRSAIPARRSDLIEYLIERVELGTEPKTLMVDCCAIRAAHLARPLPDPTVGLRRVMQPYTRMARTAHELLRKDSA